jgi:hypothetical protein
MLIGTEKRGKTATDRGAFEHASRDRREGLPFTASS